MVSLWNPLAIMDLPKNLRYTGVMVIVTKKFRRNPSPEAMPKSCRITTSVKAIDPKPITVVARLRKMLCRVFAYAVRTASLGDSPFEVASRNSATMCVSSVALDDYHNCWDNGSKRIYRHAKKLLESGGSPKSFCRITQGALFPRDSCQV